MRMSRLLLVLSLATIGLSAQDCTKLTQMKGDIYGFRPVELSKEQQNAKSKQMDLFWKEVKAEGTSGVTCVRKLLKKEEKDRYFVFDAVQILLEMDPESADSVSAIAESLPKVDLDQVDAVAYIRASMWAQQLGADTSAAAKNYLESNHADGYVPQHAMKLDRTMG